MLVLNFVQRDELDDASSQHVIQDDAGNGDEKANRSGFQCQAQTHHDGAHGDRLRYADGMERQHDSKDGSQEADVRRVGRNGADYD